MIKFYKATRPSRKRDGGRFILQIGRQMFHLTPKEALSLERQIEDCYLSDFDQSICRALNRYKKEKA